MSGFKNLSNGDPWTLVLLLCVGHAVSQGGWLREVLLTYSVSDMFGVGIMKTFSWQDLSVFDFFKSLFKKKKPKQIKTKTNPNSWNKVLF